MSKNEPGQGMSKEEP